jgi:hypothetical protein
VLRSSRVRVFAALGILVIPALLALAHRSNGLNGLSGLGSSSTAPARPGQVVRFPAYLQNRSGSPVTLESATLLALPGSGSPQLSGLAVLGGTSFKGYELQPGVRVPIRFGLSAAAPGEYAVNGLSIEVLQSGSPQTVQVSGVAGLCVSASALPCPDAFVSKVRDAARDEERAGRI